MKHKSCINSLHLCILCEDVRRSPHLGIRGREEPGGLSQAEELEDRV